jgi:hypothetical protein
MSGKLRRDGWRCCRAGSVGLAGGSVQMPLAALATAIAVNLPAIAGLAGRRIRPD